MMYIYIFIWELATLKQILLAQFFIIKMVQDFVSFSSGQWHVYNMCSSIANMLLHIDQNPQCKTAILK